MKCLLALAAILAYIAPLSAGLIQGIGQLQPGSCVLSEARGASARLGGLRIEGRALPPGSTPATLEIETDAPEALRVAIVDSAGTAFAWAAFGNGVLTFRALREFPPGCRLSIENHGHRILAYELRF